MELHHSVNENGSKECINFTLQIANSVFGIKMSLSSFAIVANLAVIVFILYTKKFRDFVYRLILYLMIIDVLQAFVIIIISQPVVVPNNTAPAQIKPGWHNACIGSGFAIMATMWMGNIIVFWIVLYLLWLGWSLYRRVYRKRKSNKISHTIHQGQDNTSKLKLKEIFGVIFLFVAPLLIAIIPVFAHGDMYGLSGLWCWIKLHNTYCNDLGAIPLVFALVFFYVPLMVIVLLVFVFIMAAFIFCCRGEVRRHDKNKKLKRRYTKEILFIFAFPLAYCCICVILLINRVYTTLHQKGNTPPNNPLWIAHAVADPLRVVLPAVVFLIHPCVWMDARARRLKFSPSADQDKLVSEDESSGKLYGSCEVNQDEYESTLVTNINT